MNEIGLLVSQVIPSHSAKSHDVFELQGGIHSVNVFPSFMHIFSHQIKNVSYSHVRKLCLNFSIVFKF